MKFKKDIGLAHAARELWTGLAPFRSRRHRLKAFAYGRQWGDVLPGTSTTEEAAMISQGRNPITNNLIRSLVKSVVGRYCTQKNASDSRALEEFLISGTVVQRLRSAADPEGSRVADFSPDRLFYLDFLRPDASDCTMLGLLHDMSLGELADRFGAGNPARIEALWKVFMEAPKALGRLQSPGEAHDFAIPSLGGTMRVIEVWRRVATPLLFCHDPEEGRIVESLYDARAAALIEDENKRRRGSGKAAMASVMRVDSAWEQSWLTPSGILLCRRRYPSGFPPQVALRFYPMIDGEVHGLVEDVVEQQKLVNRMVSMLDEVLSTSSKNCVLYPVDQLPEGISWEELRRMWGTPGSILPYRRTSKNIMPREISSGGGLAGASELLSVQLQLFQTISGQPQIRPDREQRRSAEAMEAENDRATLGVADILADFGHYIGARDSALKILERAEFTSSKGEKE